MDFSLSEEQEMLKNTARTFLKNECPESLVRDIEEGDEGYSPELWRKMAELGWLGIPFPERYGGSGGSILDMAILHEEMGRAMLPSPYLSTVVLCGLTILAAGSEEEKTDLLPGIVNGDLILALALTEPESSWNGNAWDPEGVTVRAIPRGDNYVIDGTKLFVRDARIADRLMCAARTRDGARPEDGITLFLVDAESPGISHTLLRTVAGDKQCEVDFDEVEVPRRNIVGDLHGGWPPLAKALQTGAVLLCAEMVGAGQAALELAVSYAKNRVQFDMPIGIHQYVQEHCVYLLSEVDSSSLATHVAAWTLSEGLPCDFEVAIAKAWTNEAMERAFWRAHQVLAGAGTLADAGVLPLYTKRARAAQLYLGDTRYHLRKVAEEMDRWPAPERPRGRPLGIWAKPQEEEIPAWEPWRQRWEAIRRRKEGRRL